MINVCFITDSKYVLATLVAIKSLIVNSKNDVIINVISPDLPLEYKKIFEKMSNKKCQVKVIMVENPYDNIETEHLWVSKAALLKFALPKIFYNMDKILYLDGDMLVLKDLSELFNVDVKNHYAAAVADMAGMVSEKHHIKFGFEKYFNSGMMLFNLEKMRNDNISEKLLYNKIHDKYKHFMDQDALNETLEQNVVWLSPKYNLMLENLKYCDNEIADFYDLPEDEIKNIKSNYSILHLTNSNKPWDTIETLKFNDWYVYLKKIPNCKLKRKTIKKLKKEKFCKFIKKLKTILK